MKKYEVAVSIQGYKVFEVKATNKKQAEKKIYETNDYVELKNETEWDIETIEEVK
jgi:hypothetical protein